jgi:hypothetical protein
LAGGATSQSPEKLKTNQKQERKAGKFKTGRLEKILDTWFS